VDPEQIPTPEPASSPGSEPADVSASSAAPSAESSPAKDVERQSLLDVIKDAVDPKSLEDNKEPDAAAASSAAEGESEEAAARSPNGKDDVSDDALLATLDQLKSDVPLGKIERFKEVLAENRSLKSTADQYHQLDDTLNQIGADARRMGMTHEDVVALFAWPRLLASDPAAAVEQLREFTAMWEGRIGKTLPADLQQKVEDGLLDEATAKEVAGMRANAELTKTRYEVDQQEAQRSALARSQGEIREAVNAFQAELKRTDADYTPEKHAMTIDALRAMVSERGIPQTSADGVAMAREAHQLVTDRLKAFRPAPRAVHGQSVGRRLNKPAESQPKTMEEAIRRSIGM